MTEGGTPVSGRDRAKALARERKRRAQQTFARDAVPAPASTRRQAATTCAWCNGPINVQPVGRIPKWCSQTCRQRAWEQRRAAASGWSAVTVVERVIVAPVPTTTESATRNWPALLDDLTQQLGRGHLYRRDLPDLAAALDRVLAAYRRATR